MVAFPSVPAPSTSRTKPILYYSRDCVYSRSMLEMLVRNNARGVVACVCVETQPHCVPKFVNCTPAIYVSSDKKLLKNSAVKTFVENLVRGGGGGGGNSGKASGAARSGGRTAPTPTTMIPDRNGASVPLEGASVPTTPRDPDAVNVSDRMAYTWIGGEEGHQRDASASGSLRFASLAPEGGATASPATSSNASNAPAPAVSKREAMMNARLKLLQKQRDADLVRPRS